MSTKSRNKGFTIIELMLAMALLSFILIFIVTTVVSTIQIYNKGLSLKEISQSGRSIGAEFQRSIKESADEAIVVKSNWNRICMGKVSYVWNQGNATDNTYSNGTTIGLAKVYDPSGSMCTGNSRPSVNIQRSTELLGSNIRIRYVSLTKIAEPTLYSLKYVLSSADDSLLTLTPTNQPDVWKCRENNLLIDRQFCALKVFNMNVLSNN